MKSESWNELLQRIKYTEDNCNDKYSFDEILQAARFSDINPTDFSNIINRLYKKIYINEWLKIIKSKTNDQLNWIPFSKSLEQNEFVNVLRITGPRWNCFALVGYAGPINVEQQIKINASNLSSHSDAWSLVIYSNGYQMEAVSSFGSKSGETIKNLTLKKGIYTISLRFYTDDNELYCPVIEVDNKYVINAAVFSEEKMKYQNKLIDIKNTRNTIYFWQQYYIFQKLKNRSIVDEEQVMNEFVPVADPNTYFEYGYLAQGTILKLAISSITIQLYRIYIAYYNEMSLPIYWTQINQSNWNGLPIEEDGAYLVRFVPRGKAYSHFPKPEYYSAKFKQMLKITN